ncbi:hybrid sensor histidine kinase/response regulator [Sphingomonas echinoides]|uniref:histidine kinase n=1 Tax=Sphingomonas echinoides TaxID=59803 RepID=A0ABU4PQV4_9SPHN|nr:NahK/ErcS family hybrid sensor histidine kinase/response regulator [Sphingomonas echinoides]MDX5986329.1 NahK/ErcS family hybrid sensor histidine kinase/response regulator [Sphingomonas echinoides]
MATRIALPDSHDAGQIAALEAEIVKLKRINTALIDRVERSTDLQGNAFSLFETAISLEGKVRERTADLEQALGALARSNAALGIAKETADDAQRRLRDAIESINEGFAIFDADDRLVLCNQTYLGLWPKIADRIVPGISFSAITDMIGKDGTTLGAMVARDRWVSERMAQRMVASGGHVHALADGRWIQINELRTSEGGIVGVYTDITEVKAEDARLRARELAQKSAILQATLDTIPQGVCVYDADRRLVAWNNPLLAVIGLPADGIAIVATHDGLVAGCAELNGPMEPDEPLAWLESGIRDAVSRRHHRSGKVVEVHRARMPDGGMVMSFGDITESLRAADRLRETNETLERRVEERTADINAVNRELSRENAERLAVEAALRDAKTAAEQANISKTRFLAAASHDLLQPLNAARLFVAALGDRRLALPTRALVRQAGSALDSVEDLLESLLEISRLDAGAIVAEPVDFALDEMLRSMKAEFAPVARERRLVLRIDDGAFWVRSDPRLLRRILQNLIGNALRYTHAGSVDVAVRAEGEMLHVEVIDTGPGIAPEHHVEIFEEFRRIGDHGRDRGMGLGLAIVQRAARMLGHALSVRSALGEGSRFGVCVPVGTSTPRVSHAAAPSRSGPLTDQVVLVIDNETLILEGMAVLLEGWGCTVLSARDLGAGQAQANTLRPNLIIADYHLDDGQTGIDAIAGVRAATGASIPAIVITADRTPELRDLLAAADFHVLQKPVKPAQLRALITRLTQ